MNKSLEAYFFGPLCIMFVQGAKNAAEDLIDGEATWQMVYRMFGVREVIKSWIT